MSCSQIYSLYKVGTLFEGVIRNVIIMDRMLKGNSFSKKHFLRFPATTRTIERVSTHTYRRKSRLDWQYAELASTTILCKNKWKNDKFTRYFLCIRKWLILGLKAEKQLRN